MVHPPSLPGGQEGVAPMQKLGGLLMCSVHGVAHSQQCQCRVCMRCEGAWCTLTCEAGDILHVYQQPMLCYVILAYFIHADMSISICIVISEEHQ